jgi:hypothetical protein
MFGKLLLVTLVLAPGAAMAAKPELPLQSDMPFQAQQAKVRADLGGGEVYSEINRDDRAAVIAALDRMSATIGEGSAEALSPADKVAVFNDQELVNALLTKAGRDSRLVCRREKQVGSNMPTTQCLTAAQRERMRGDGARDMGGLRPRSGNGTL